MEPENIKNKALTKEETKGLILLIEGSKIINNKKTNATSNKMKVEEWQRITDVFNANIAICRRTPAQLRLKWENLKKNSRKRSAQMRMERIKTGGGPAGYFPPDDILDRVSAMLGNTGEGLPSMFGGDAGTVFGDGCVNGDGSVMGVGRDLSTFNSPPQIIMLDSQLPTNVGTISKNTDDCIIKVSDENSADMASKIPISNFNDGVNSALIMPKQKKIQGSNAVKRKLLKRDDGRLARNIALAEYYNLKKKILEANYENIKLENQKLKLEIKKLKGEDTTQ